MRLVTSHIFKCTYYVISKFCFKKNADLKTCQKNSEEIDRTPNRIQYYY